MNSHLKSWRRLLLALNKLQIIYHFINIFPGPKPNLHLEPLKIPLSQFPKFRPFGLLEHVFKFISADFLITNKVSRKELSEREGVEQVVNKRSLACTKEVEYSHPLAHSRRVSDSRRQQRPHLNNPLYSSSHTHQMRIVPLNYSNTSSRKNSACSKLDIREIHF